MAIFSVTYDLIKTKDYAKLFEGFKSVPGTHVRPTESQWLLDTTWNEEKIRDHLKQYIDNDDKLFVAQIYMPRWASRKINTSVTDWLHERKNSN